MVAVKNETCTDICLNVPLAAMDVMKCNYCSGYRFHNGTCATCMDGKCIDCEKTGRVHQVDSCAEGQGCCGKYVCYPECVITCSQCHQKDDGTNCVYQSTDIWCVDCAMTWASQHNKEQEPFFIALQSKTYWYKGEYEFEGHAFRHTGDGIRTWNGISAHGYDTKYSAFSEKARKNIVEVLER